MSPEQQAVGEAVSFVGKVNDIILFPLIALLTGIAFLVFLYGCAIYIVSANNASAREDGRKHIMYGIIGLLIMLIAYSILTLAANTFGLGGELDCADDPTASECAGITVPRP